MTCDDDPIVGFLAWLGATVTGTALAFPLFYLVIQPLAKKLLARYDHRTR